MQKYYNFADAMIVTLGKDEFALKTLPGKVQACMATANPIIASADGETKEVIEEAKCGYCVTAGDYKKLANVMKEFSLLDRISKINLGENSFKFYENNFKKKNFIKKLIIILEKEGNKNV